MFLTIPLLSDRGTGSDICRDIFFPPGPAVIDNRSILGNNIYLEGSGKKKKSQFFFLSTIPYLHLAVSGEWLVCYKD